MQPVKHLIRIQHGSHLYGTSTPASDQDFKGVFVPAGRDILLQRVPAVIDCKVKVSAGPKNTAEDVDDQSFNVQKFLHMVTSGDTVGTEILFAPDEFVIEMHPDWQMIRDSKHLLLNKQCKGFVGYCQRQAAKYGIKGSRMSACRDLVALLEPFAIGHPTDKLETLSEALAEFCTHHEFSEITIITSQAGTAVPHLDVVDRKVPYTATIKTAYDIYAKVFANYGHRTLAAMQNEGIDWKAVSHAIRVAGQAKELLLTGHITFPRPDAAFLLEVKQGKLDYNDVAPLLERMVEEVDVASKESTLPGKSDLAAIDELVINLHHYQLVELP